jgi:hypothetical protein
MPAILAALASGLLFGLGLTVSQMINPAKVIGFLDILGDFDPSLAFVMATAIPGDGAGLHACKTVEIAALRIKFQLADAETDRSASGFGCCPVRRRLGIGRLLSWPGGRRARSR